MLLPPKNLPPVGEDGFIDGRWYQFFTRQGVFATYRVLAGYTPTVSSASGTITTAVGNGRYIKIDNLVYVEIDVAITTNGTGAGTVTATLPFASSPAAIPTLVIAGRETALAGKMLQGFIAPNASLVSIVNYDNTYPGANGARLSMTGCYESA